jgi:hypothetical protein
MLTSSLKCLEINKDSKRKGKRIYIDRFLILHLIMTPSLTVSLCCCAVCQHEGKLIEKINHLSFVYSNFGLEKGVWVTESGIDKNKNANGNPCIYHYKNSCSLIFQSLNNFKESCYTSVLEHCISILPFSSMHQCHRYIYINFMKLFIKRS